MQFWFPTFWFFYIFSLKYLLRIGWFLLNTQLILFADEILWQCQLFANKSRETITPARKKNCNTNISTSLLTSRELLFSKKEKQVVMYVINARYTFAHNLPIFFDYVYVTASETAQPCSLSRLVNMYHARSAFSIPTLLRTREDSHVSLQLHLIHDELCEIYYWCCTKGKWFFY